MPRALGLLACALVLAACEAPTPAPDPIAADTTGERICTTEFRTVPVTVLDAAGQPVTGASFDVLRTSADTSVVCTGAPSEACLEGQAWGEGQYPIVSDAVPVDEAGEAFRLVITHGSTRLDTTYQIGYDGCHVFKASGPDTLRLAR